jgi:hypothetical protein
MIRYAWLVLSVSTVAMPIGISAAVAKDKPENPAQPDPNKKICRYSQKTGSIMRTAECHTAADWAYINNARAEVARQGLDKLKTTRILKDDF